MRFGGLASLDLASTERSSFRRFGCFVAVHLAAMALLPWAEGSAAPERRMTTLLGSRPLLLFLIFSLFILTIIVSVLF
jgi:hypothetical protein